MQETRVRSLVPEDPACAARTEPVLWSPRALEPVLRNKGSHCMEKPEHRNEEQRPPASTGEKPREQRRRSTV
ncbi:hypothetical protein JEQ12_009371 [Ovis aries]|uniref:Uncharacterized protein n=1 Tax=Ovis aries TaxID=9940 RepID=A0A836AMB1_SHEEP|nr:hypothetical protein JEQ12_009371 [Ovis aries]